MANSRPSFHDEFDALSGSARRGSRPDPTQSMLAALSETGFRGISVFLAAGADPRAAFSEDDAPRPMFSGMSALAMAARKNDPVATRDLLLAGADPRSVGEIDFDDLRGGLAALPTVALSVGAEDVIRLIHAQFPDIDPGFQGVLSDLSRGAGISSSAAIPAFIGCLPERISDSQAADLARLVVRRFSDGADSRDDASGRSVEALLEKFGDRIPPAMIVSMASRALRGGDIGFAMDILGGRRDRIFNEAGLLRREARVSADGKTFVHPDSLPWLCIKAANFDAFESVVKNPFFLEQAKNPASHSVAAAFSASTIRDLSCLARCGFDFKTKGAKTGKTLLTFHLEARRDKRKEFIAKLLSLDPGILDVVGNDGVSGREALALHRDDAAKMEADAVALHLNRLAAADARASGSGKRVRKADLPTI